MAENEQVKRAETDKPVPGSEQQKSAQTVPQHAPPASQQQKSAQPVPDHAAAPVQQQK